MDRAVWALRLFGTATLIQVLVGFWFLFTLGAPVMEHFMGQDLLKTVPLLIGMLAGIGAIATAFAGKLGSTVIQLLVALLGMVITRYNLRLIQLEPFFKPSSLTLAPQYDVLAVFLLILVVGLGVVVYLLRISLAVPKAGGAQ